jgi:hypothetical protein
MADYRIGELTAVTILAELGDCTRFSCSRQAVRYAGIDITVDQSDRRRAPGHICRQGPPALRWALYEAAQVATRPGSPDRDYYLQAAERVGANRACLSVARKLLKRGDHTLRELGEEALAPASGSPVRAKPPVTQMRRGRLPAVCCRHHPVDGPETPSGRNASPSEITPITHHVAGPAANPRVADRSKAGRPRAHDPLSRQPCARTTLSCARSSSTPTTPDHALDVRSPHK